MADDENPDRLLSELPDVPNQQRERTGSMSLGAAPTANGDEVSPINGDSASMAAPPPAQLGPLARSVDTVVNSEIGVQTLLNRLKQSIASAKEFAAFLKKRGSLEQEHSDGIKSMCRRTHEQIRRPEHRHGSFLMAYDELINIHDRMADNGAQFAISLHQMHDDLQELAANMEKGRKHWKTTGLTYEQRAADMEAAMRKSKAKYDSLAEDLDRVKTGGGQSTKGKFGLKKSGPQHEEDLHRKLQAAEQDYSSKVQAAQSQRAELWSKQRPEAVRALEDLIRECDSALTLQMQKFASFNEKLLLSNGLNVSPLTGDQGSHARSLREVVSGIDNEVDLSSYISSHVSKVPPRGPDIKFERHPTLIPQQMSAPPPQRQSDPPGSYGSRQGPPQSFGAVQSPHQSHMSQPFNQLNQNSSSPAVQQHERSFSQGPSMQFSNGGMGGPPRGPPPGQGPPQLYGAGSISSSGPPQLSSLPFQTSKAPSPTISSFQQPPPPTQSSYGQAPNASMYTQPPPAAQMSNLPPLRPVFGLSLEQLFERDQSAVPMVVYQCIQAVDLFGLEVEGIYRLSGTASHITKIKAMFDNDAGKVDFRNPENFFHDVNSVAGLLKQFFRDLPDPLLTAEHYKSFIEAAKNDDDIVRRDSLHAIINSLPDPNYATLRALTLHLNRVQENSPSNRMNASNLAIVFGPTLMGANTGPNIQDAGWQVRVIDTILQNTYQIFDDD